MKRSAVALLAVALALVVCAGDVRLRAQDRFLGREDIVLLGLGLTVEPAHQTVPRDVATIVSTFLSAPTAPADGAPPFAPDAIVKATLRGPGAGSGIALAASPNTPFNIPPLGTAGTYSLDDIRLESGGELLLRGVPESVTIEVLDTLLVTQVTARPLSADEIRTKGIVFDKSNFQAYNFTAAFAVQDTPIHISFPVLLPTLKGAQDVSLESFSGGGKVPEPKLPQLKTLIPDTLTLQTQLPNLQVVGFTLTVPGLKGQQLIVPPIPGVVVIPGDIGFLNQVFSVMLLVGNVAPEGSHLVVDDLTGEIHLPAGNDTVVGSDDDPLRMAQTTGGVSPGIQLVVQPGPDGKLGTADDVAQLAPGQNGSAEYLVEGRREGTWVVEFALTGTLHGLPIGPVTVQGRAAGSVLVRNPSFTLTFTHPEVVSAREPYSLDVTVTNTSGSPANFVSVNLHPQHVTGATVIGEPTREIDSIPPGESATVSFDLVSRVTGKVTAATLDTEDKVQGRFALKTAVGELGVPLSPDSLVLPTEAGALPGTLRAEVLSLLGKAWAVATAPAVALPKDVKRISKQIVLDRAVQAAEAGFRIRLHEPSADSAAQLAMDIIGSDFARLSTFYPDAGALQFARGDFVAFDELRRRSIRGDTFAKAVGALLTPDLTGLGAAVFHRTFAEKAAYRPAHLSVLALGAGALPYTISLVDAQGRRIGRSDAAGKVVKQIPFADLVPFVDAAGAVIGQLIVLAAPDAGEYHLQFDRVGGVSANDPFELSLVVPAAGGGLRQVAFSALTGRTPALSPFTSGDPYRVTVDLPAAGEAPQGSASATFDAAIVPPAPHVIGVVQQADKDLSMCAAIPLGRVVAVLFSAEVTPASVQDRRAASDITNYAMADNRVVGVALQPGRRIAFLGLRDGIGPFVARTLSIEGVSDAAGRAMAAETVPIETTVFYPAAVADGQVLEADGTPVPFAEVRFFVWDGDCGPVGVSAKTADDKGRFTWDYLPAGSLPAQLLGPISLDGISPNRISAFNPATDDGRKVNFSVQRPGQRLNVNVVFLGRGTLRGRTVAEDGSPLANTVVRVTSLTDDSSYGMTTDAKGEFVFGRLPVGNVFIQAVNVDANSQGTASELIPIAGATVVRNVRLFDISSPAITVKYGGATGHVLKGDGTAPAIDVPVVAYYQSNSQPGVRCPDPSMSECAMAMTRTDGSGRFQLDQVPAGQVRLNTFDQATLHQGEARVAVPADGTVDVNLRFAEGLGTVTGTVVTAAGAPVAGARVGGGLSLTVADATGHFTLTDVPVGRREIVAVDDQAGTRATAMVDLLQAGQTVNVTLVVPATGAVAGTVFAGPGPVPGARVYLIHPFEGSGDQGQIVVAASATTDDNGHYGFQNVPLRADYTVSSFRQDFSDGNLRQVALKVPGQVARVDIVYRGGGGRVTGRVLAADGQTPLAGAVGISGDRVVVAGALVGVKFEHVANYQIQNTDLGTGSFQFSNVLVGPFTITAAGQFSPDPVGVASTMPSAGATVNVDVTLQATSRIGGIVYGPDGVTPAGANVVVRYKSSSFKVVCARTGTIVVGDITIAPGECRDVPQGIQDETVVTDSAGRYVLPLVTGGQFSITAEDPANGRTGETIGSINPGQSGDFPVRLLGLSTLIVNVRGSDTTTPIPGARVEVTQISYPKKKVIGVADAAGTLTLAGGDAFTEGELAVMATDLLSGFAGRASGRVTRDGQTVTVTVFLYNASGSVSGVVFKADGITPAPNAEVVISNPSGPLAFGITDENGAYHQDLIPLGSFRVDVFEAATARRGFASGRIDLDTQDVPVNVVEAARGLVTGTALTEGSLTPIRNWQVFLTQIFPGGGRYAPTLQTTTDVDGTFSLPGVLAGDFTVSIYNYNARPGDPVGQGTATATLETDGQHVDLPVIVKVFERRYGRVEGTAFNADGTPAADLQIDLCAYSSCSLDVPATHLFTQTAADGTFAIDHAPVGRFQLSARSQVSKNAATAYGELLFEGDVARVSLSLVGVSQIHGTVVYADGSAARNVQLSLSGQPSSGCYLFCSGFTDDAGAFAFIDVPARTFSIYAADVVSGLKGSISGALNPGDQKDVRIVLQATTAVAGRVLSAAGAPASGMTVELAGTTVFDQVHLFQVTDEKGLFSFAAVVNGAYNLFVQDPIGPGYAKRTVQASGIVALGDITLDEAAPAVSAMTPQPASTGVALTAQVRIAFSEPVGLATVTQPNISLAGPAGPVLGTLQLVDGDTAALFTPLQPLVQNTRYSVSVAGIADRVGKAMAAPFTASFTTIDLVPPTAVDLTPAAGGSGIPLASVVRVKFSEPIAPALFSGPPIVLTRGGAPVAGRTEFILGNTVVVFTPAAQLDEDTEYGVRVAAATDVAGNTQPQPLSYLFRTLDRTPPQITALTPAGDGTVIENGVTQVVADVGTSHDIAVVDFFLNDQPTAPVRTPPFALTLQAVSSLGKPGDRIKVSALATDTSGNRGTTPAVAFIAVVADQPPAVSIVTPAEGTQFRTGDRVTVTVHVTDDLGAAQLSYRALTGKPQDAGSQPIAPPGGDVTRTFAFSIAADAVPGAPIAIHASAVDSKGQVANAVPVSIGVVDNTPPTVSITGTTTGARVSPGQQTSAIVSASDLGGIASLSFTTGGVLVGTQVRPVSPPQNAVVTSFAMTVPATAHAGDTLTLDATATDAAGNVASAGRVLLPIADLNGPVVQLRLANGGHEITPGAAANVVATVTDDTGVASVALAGQGAFTVTQARQVSPISNSAELVFTIPVPAEAANGAALNVSATATDIFGNVSAPATLALTVRTLTGVVLPPSLLIAAGDQVPFDVALSAPAPAGGITVNFASTDEQIAQVSAAVQFAEGETVKPAVVTGIRGGNVSMTASIAGSQRASTTVVVRGGVVSGTVFDPQFAPVAGAQVTVTGFAGLGGRLAVTDTDGSYRVEGVTPAQDGRATIRVLDPATGRIGFGTGLFNASNGFTHVNIVLVSAGTIAGTVTTPDGHTPAGAGVRVNLFAASDPIDVAATTLTDGDGLFEFPIVSPGIYVLEAFDAAGNRGRTAPVTVAASGQRVDVVLSYLGRGSVIGTVRNGAGQPVPNIPLTLSSSSLFGPGPIVTGNSLPDGTFRFDDVFVGTFTLQARDALNNSAASTSGSIAADHQVVTADLRLAQWGGIEGTVFSTDGATPLAGVLVQLSASGTYLSTTTSDTGHYAFTFVPLGSYYVEARVPATHGLGRIVGTLTVHGLTVTQNVTLFAQGTLVVTVTDSFGNPIAGASVSTSSSDERGGDSNGGTTNGDGVALIEHVYASNNVWVSAHANGLSGYVLTTMPANVVKAVTVALEATASIVGTVFLPDGQTPAAGAAIASCDGCLKVPVNADGTFRMDLTLRTWGPVAYDAQGRRRAVARNVVLNQNGQVVTVNMTFIGLGTVSGRVLNPDNSSAPNLFVTIRSLDPDLGGYDFKQTNAGGFYEAQNVAVGAIAVTTGDTSRGLLGEASGTLVRDGDTLNLDVLLKSNAITPPVTRGDGNFFTFDVQKDGSIGAGFNFLYSSACCGLPGGAAHLDLVAGGVASRFIGSNIATTEDGGREVVLTQQNLAGLNVTRKVLVSPAYFARYLELLTNPTAAPITVDVRVVSNVRVSQIQKTSSGDAVLDAGGDAADRWLTLNTGSDVDPFQVTYGPLPQPAFAFGGLNARQRAAVATFVPSGGELTVGWNTVTVNPGQTVGFMHFVVQQYSRAAAEASVTRLEQVPPEALLGMSQSEIGAVQNFAIAADGTSAVAALPPLGGTINGTVFEVDGVTPVSSVSAFGGTVTNVRMQSSVVYFGRTYRTSATTIGAFTFGPGATVPLAPFTLDSEHTRTQVVSAPTLGTYPPGSSIATANIVFSNTAMARGKVRRATGDVVAAASITAGVSPYVYSFAPSAADGSFMVSGLLPGATIITAAMPHAQGPGFSLKASASVTFAAGDVRTADLTIQPTGVLTGTVRTAPGPVSTNTLVRLYGVDAANPFTALQTFTDSGGVYRFTDVPVGTPTLRVNDPLTNVVTSVPVAVMADQTTTADVSMLPIASVDASVQYTDGQPAVSAFVEIQQSAVDQSFRSAGVTGANGHLTIANVPGGAFVVRAHRPGNYSSATVDVAGTVTTHGATLPLTAVVPPLGTVVVRVTTPAGAPVQGARVESDVNFANFAQQLGSTDGNGELTIANVIGGRTFKVRAYEPPGFSDYREASSRLTDEGQVLVVGIVLATTGSVNGHVMTADGAPAVSATVQVVSDIPRRIVAATTDAFGAFRIDGVAVGDFRVTSRDYNNTVAGSLAGRIDSHGQTITAEIALTGVVLPISLSDANGGGYRVGADGQLGGGSLSSTDGFGGAFRLQTGVKGNFDYGFGGDAYLAESELAGRQLALRDFNLGNAVRPVVSNGVTLSRKVYVPESGYFARYLEIIENVTAAPVALDVKLLSTFNSTRIVSTSSGDGLYTSADRWVVTDAPAYPNPAAVAHVVSGPGAAAPPTDLLANNFFLLAPSERWDGLVVPAGGRVILMHFAVQEPSGAAAQAAAERLVGLPPEALEGLTPAERQAIVNFAVPPDGPGAVAAFATVTGTVRVAEGLGPVAGARVTVTGNAGPIFKAAIVVRTDAAGRYRSNTLAAGPYTVQAADSVTGALTPVVSGIAGESATVVQDLAFTTVGTLTGTVRFPDGSPATPGPHGGWYGSTVVTVTGGSPAISVQAPIAADGTYTVSAIQAGTYIVQWVVQTSTPYFQQRFATTSGVIVTAGQTTVADVQVSAVATVRLTARRADGTPLASTWMNISTSYGYGFQNAGRTDANGVLLIGNVPQGAFTIHALAADFVSVIGAADGIVGPADDGRTIDVVLQLFVSTATGTVFARDGATPLGGAFLELYDAATGLRDAYSYSRPDGSYRFENVTLASGGRDFRIVAYSPTNFDVTVEHTGRFDLTPVVIDFTLPVATIRGTLTYFDGSAATSVYVAVAQEDAFGNVATSAAATAADGTFMVIATPGPFELLAQDGNGMLEAGAKGVVPDTGTAPVVALVFQPSATVSGTVRTHAGDPAADAQSAVSSANSAYASQYSQMVPFEFVHVPTGRFSVQACQYADQYVCGFANGSLDADGSSADVEVALAGTGEVAVNVVAADGVTALPTQVLLLAGSDGPMGLFSGWNQTDADGLTQFAGVPEGVVTAVAYDPDTFAFMAMASGTLSADGSLSLTVRQGTAVPCPVVLPGASGVTYAVDCDGALTSSGGNESSIPASYQAASSLRINGVSATSATASRLEAGGRQIVTGPFQLAGVQVNRKTYVPPSGAFARHLDTLTNPSSAPVTVDVQMTARVDGAVRIHTDPAITGNTYAVTVADPQMGGGETITKPALGLVFGGLGADLGTDAIRLPFLFRTASYRWTVTIPAGGSVALMHFVVQRDGADAAAADAQAQALANLTDPEALAALTPAEKALVVNFRVP